MGRIRSSGKCGEFEIPEKISPRENRRNQLCSDRGCLVSDFEDPQARNKSRKGGEPICTMEGHTPKDYDSRAHRAKKIAN